MYIFTIIMGSVRTTLGNFPALIVSYIFHCSLYQDSDCKPGGWCTSGLGTGSFYHAEDIKWAQKWACRLDGFYHQERLVILSSPICRLHGSCLHSVVLVKMLEAPAEDDIWLGERALHHETHPQAVIFSRLCFWDSLNLYQSFQFISLLFLCCLTNRFASVQCICVMEENSNWGTQRMAHCVIILQFYICWKLVWNKNNLFKASEFCWCCRWSASSCDKLVQIWSVIWVLSM